jgi:hypothetical protein
MKSSGTIAYGLSLFERYSTLPWTAEEDELFREKFGEFGPKWARMAQFFPGRTDVSLKNHWAAMLSRQARPVPLRRRDRLCRVPNPGLEGSSP